MNAKTKKYGILALALFGALALAAAVSRALATTKANPATNFSTALQGEVTTVAKFS